MNMDDWEIDAAVAGSQKGLMVPPGLGIVAIGPRAWEKSAVENSAILLGLEEVLTDVPFTPATAFSSNWKRRWTTFMHRDWRIF